jgi:hypothetical protein
MAVVRCGQCGAYICALRKYMREHRKRCMK